MKGQACIFVQIVPGTRMFSWGSGIPLLFHLPHSVTWQGPETSVLHGYTACLQPSPLNSIRWQSNTFLFLKFFFSQSWDTHPSSLSSCQSVIAFLSSPRICKIYQFPRYFSLISFYGVFFLMLSKWMCSFVSNISSHHRLGKTISGKMSLREFIFSTLWGFL